MGLGPIPFSEISNYCEFFSEEDPAMFIYVINRADQAYLQEQNKSGESDGKSNRKTT